MPIVISNMHRILFAWRDKDSEKGHYCHKIFLQRKANPIFFAIAECPRTEYYSSKMMSFYFFGEFVTKNEILTKILDFANFRHNNGELLSSFLRT